MATGTAQIGEEPGKDTNEPGKGIEEIQETANEAGNESANEASEVSLQDSSLQEVQHFCQ